MGADCMIHHSKEVQLRKDGRSLSPPKRTHLPRSTEEKLRRLSPSPEYPTAVPARWVAHGQTPRWLQRIHREKEKDTKKQQPNKVREQSPDGLRNSRLTMGSNPFAPEHGSSCPRKRAADSVEMLTQKSGHLVLTEEI